MTTTDDDPKPYLSPEQIRMMSELLCELVRFHSTYVRTYKRHLDDDLFALLKDRKVPYYSFDDVYELPRHLTAAISQIGGILDQASGHDNVHDVLRRLEKRSSAPDLVPQEVA